MRVAGVPESPTGARVVRDEDGVVLENTLVRARFDNRGLLVSLLDLVADREVVPPDDPGNLFQLFRDTPREWDAWDIDATYENVGSDLTGEAVITIVVDRPDAAAVRFDRSVGASTISQTVSLSAGSPALDLAIDIDWHERQKLLKLAFPLDLHADRAASEIQFGHIHRPTHANTSWDAARFETCAHRWVHVGEPGYGVSVANDSTYGHDISRRSEDHGTVTTVRLSLLRAPVFPDPDADQGRHTLRVALRPGSSVADAVSEGYRLNLPLRRITGHREVAPLVDVDNSAVIVEAIKLAEDGSGDVIVRLYESLGGRADATVTAGFHHSSVIETDLLERPLVGGTALSAGHGVTRLRLRPFQIVTLRFAPASD